MTTTTIENKYETIDLMNKVIDNIAYFVMNDSEIKNDYEEYVKTIGGETITNTIPYIFERVLDSKSIPELYLSKNKKLEKEEKTIVKGLIKNVSSIFEVKKVQKNKFELYNIINEKMYTVISPIKMTAFRGLGIGYYIVARFFNYEKEHYLIELIGIYPASRKNDAYKHAVSKIIANPELVYFDNKNIEKKISQKALYSYNRFNELFNSDEITTSNKYADDLIEYLNGSIDELDWKSKIEDVNVSKYFDVSNSSSNIFQNGGFSSHKDKFDVTLLVDKDWGFYALPFYKTFCNLFEGKIVKNAENLIAYYLETKAIGANILNRVATKYENFMEVINSIMKTDYTFETLIQKYKPLQTYASATILEESNVFSKLVDIMQEESERQETPVIKVGRNDPCSCGSGKKYKKCCMLKEN